MTMTMIVFVCIWFAFGALSSGFNFAYFQRKYPGIRMEEFYRDQKDELPIIFFGPMAMVGLFLTGVKYGWLWPWSEKAKREAGIK